VLTTVSGEEEGERIAEALVSEGLAACVNIIGGVRSIYRWKGAIENDRETLLIVKTSQECFDRLQARVTELHSYDVPEIVAVDLTRLSTPYEAFLRDSLDGTN
jgi:periplasmic divalent cation tolerance protein